MTYESEFGKVIDANIDTTGPGTTGAIDIQILSQSESLVEVTNTSHDTKLVERELVSGDVVETVTEGQNGSFTAASTISKSTDKSIFGVTHAEGGGGSSGGMTLSSTYEADLTFTDDASSSESTETTQSGSYNDEGEYSGTSTLTRTLVDDYFSEYQGDSYWESDDIIQVIDFEREAQGETTRTFSSSETYSNEETTASWTSSFETTWSWSTHADILEFGYHTIFNDSDSGTSDNDDSGTYTPNNNPIPFYQNFRLRTLIIMVVGGGQPGAEESAGTGTEQATGQGQVQNNSIAGAIGQLFVDVWNFLSSRSGNSPSANSPGNQTSDTASYDGDGSEFLANAEKPRGFWGNYFHFLRNPNEMDTDLRYTFYGAAGTATVAAGLAAVIVAAPCLAGGTAAGFGSTALTGTTLGNAITGAGLSGVLSVGSNLWNGRDPFSNAPANIIVGGLGGAAGGNMFGSSARGVMAAGGLTGFLEGGVNEFLNGGSPSQILQSASTNAVLGAVTMGIFSKLFKCFAKDTIVWTTRGPKPIGEIAPGERVRAYHFEYGEWVHATVTDRSQHDYRGPVVTVEVGGSKIETTIYHPFWVVEGENFDERAVPKELLPEEDEGKSLKGRWVNSHDLRAGDKIFTLSGKLETIKAVSQRFEESFAVCNLTIDEMHNYAVGLCGVLVHNISLCGANEAFKELGEGFARYADELLKKLTKGERNSITIAVTRILENGMWKTVVGVNGGASPSAVAKLRTLVEDGGGIFFQAEGRGHAERHLYDLFGNYLEAIGVSHWKGPCREVCRPFFESTWPNIHWTGIWK